MKLSSIFAIAILVASPAAFAQGKNYNSAKSNTSGLSATQDAGQASSQYIHRPDSTQYHPGGQSADAPATSPAPAMGRSQYIHRPDSTQYHPGGKKDGSTGGISAEDDWETPKAKSSQYIHRPDSTQYHPSSKKKGQSTTD